MYFDSPLGGPQIVATRVHPDTLEIFYRNWHAWRFPQGVPVKVIASGLDPRNLFFLHPADAGE